MEIKLWFRKVLDYYFVKLSGEIEQYSWVEIYIVKIDGFAND